MKVTVSPYHRSVTIDGIEVRQKILEFPNALNHLASISCTYDKDSNTVVELSDMHRYVSHFTEREYFNTHLPEFVAWYYAEKQAQIEEEVRLQKYKEDVENAIGKTVEAGKEAQANIATDKTNALEEISTAKSESLASINDTTTSSLTSINTSRSSAITEIINNRNSITESINQTKTEAINTLNSVKDNTIEELNNKQREAEASIEVYKTSAQTAVDATGKTNIDDLNDKGTNYLNQTKEQVSIAKQYADAAKEAAENASSVSEVGPATRDRLGIVKIGRGLEVNEEGLIEVRSSITMLAPIVEAPDVLPLGYNSVFTMQAYPGLGKTSIKQYRCTLENVGTQIINADSETGAGTVTFVVPRAIGEDVILKLSVTAIDNLNNESLTTELTRVTKRAFVNAPTVSISDSTVYPLKGFKVTSSEFTTTALADTHDKTSWIIAKDTEAKVVVLELANTTDLYEHTFTRAELANKVIPNQTYYVFAKYKGNILPLSEYGTYAQIQAKPDEVIAPVIHEPTELEVIYKAAGFVVSTESDFETIGTDDTHISTDWIITEDKAGKQIVVNIIRSSDLKVHKFTPTELAHLEEKVYYVRIRFNGKDIGNGRISEPISIISRPASIQAPVLDQEAFSYIYPTGGIELSTSSVFTSFGIPDDVHKSTDWFLYSREDRTTIVAQALQSSDLYSHVFPANVLTNLEIGKVYYASCRFNGEKIETGTLSDTVSLITKGAYIHAPQISSPTYNVDVYRAAGFTVFTESIFKTTGAEDEHISSDYIIARDVDGLDIVVSAMNSSDLKRHTFTADDIKDLEIGESYYVLMRFNGAVLNKGTQSSAIKILVKPAAIKAPIIDNINDNDDCYYLGGLLVSTSTEFETIGLESDTHVSSDWIVSKDISGRQIIAQALDSSDLKTHFFSADELSSMVDETEYYVFVRYNGETISKGILSSPVKVIAKPASIVAPVIDTPEENAPLYYLAGLQVSTNSTFESIGISDVHISTDWILTSENNPNSVVAEILDSPSLKTVYFNAEDLGTLNDEQPYYVWARFNGQIIRKGTLSNPVTVIAKPAGLKQPSIIDPENNSEVVANSGLIVTLDDYTPFGLNDPQIGLEILVSLDSTFQDESKIIAHQYREVATPSIDFEPAPDSLKVSCLTQYSNTAIAATKNRRLGTTTGVIIPTEAQLNSLYANSSYLQTNIKWINGFQKFTIPLDGYYQFIVKGAHGGNAYGLAGGRGAEITGTRYCYKGEILYLLLGQIGTCGATSSSYRFGGSGGGASLVLLQVRENTKNALYSEALSAWVIPLIVAGGGAGRAGNNNEPIEVTDVQNDDATLNAKLDCIEGNMSDGANYTPEDDTTIAGGGKGLLSILKDAQANPVPTAANYGGGFGGGGTSSTNNITSGGGGGYSGGSVSHPYGSQGGTSYVHPTLSKVTKQLREYTTTEIPCTGAIDIHYAPFKVQFLLDIINDVTQKILTNDLFDTYSSVSGYSTSSTSVSSCYFTLNNTYKITWTTDQANLTYSGSALSTYPVAAVFYDNAGTYWDWTGTNQYLYVDIERTNGTLIDIIGFGYKDSASSIAPDTIKFYGMNSSNQWILLNTQQRTGTVDANNWLKVFLQDDFIINIDGSNNFDSSKKLSYKKYRFELRFNGKSGSRLTGQKRFALYASATEELFNTYIDEYKTQYSDDIATADTSDFNSFLNTQLLQKTEHLTPIYIKGRYKGETLNFSAWSDITTFALNKGILTTLNRMIYRHKSGLGTVIEGTLGTKNYKLFVLDSAYWTKSAFGTQFPVITDYQSATTATSFGANGTTDENIVTLFPAVLNDKSATWICNQLVNTYGLSTFPAIEFARSKFTDIFNAPLQIPNIVEASIIWMEILNIQQIDPTFESSNNNLRSAYMNSCNGYTSANYNRQISTDHFWWYRSATTASSWVVPVYEIQWIN